MGLGKNIEVGVEVYIDLADYYSGMFPEKAITEEGRQGLVSIWINGKIEYGYDICSFFPVGIGVTGPSPFKPERPDPAKSFDYSILKASLPFYQASLFNSSDNGQSWGNVETSTQITPSCPKLTLGEIGFNVYRVEITKTKLYELISETFSPNLSSGIINPLGIQRSSINLVNKLIEFDNEKINPNLTLKGNIYRFSCTDDGERGIDGVINFLNGGLDTDMNGIRDNCYPVVPNLNNS